MKKTFLRRHDHNYISDISGFKFKAKDAVKGVGLEKGLLMDKSEFSKDNPQLYLKINNRTSTIVNVRPRQPRVFVDPPTAEELP